MLNRLDWPCLLGGDPPLVIPDREQFMDALVAAFGSTDPVGAMLTVEKLGRNRTRQQLKYLFGVVYAVAQLDETFGGWTKDDMHGYFKEKHLRRTKELKGQVVDVAGTTTKLSSEEMATFIDAVIRDLGEMGIHTPEPGESHD
jgi:hypothetical protein